MPKKLLKIVISGECESGKTLLAHRLATLLESEGNSVQLFDGHAVTPRTGEKFKEPRQIIIQTKLG